MRTFQSILLTIVFDKMNWLTKLKSDLTTFGIHDFDNFSQFLQQNNAVIAGGFVLNATCPFKNNTNSNDIDLFTIYKPQIYKNVTQYIKSIGYELQNQSKKKYYQSDDENCRFSCYITTVDNYFHPIHKTQLQYIILKVDPSIHLKTFDIPVCSTYYDGSYEIKNPYQITDYYTIDFLTKKIKKSRFIKYLERGFTFNCDYKFE